MLSIGNVSINSIQFNFNYIAQFTINLFLGASQKHQHEQQEDKPRVTVAMIDRNVPASREGRAAHAIGNWKRTCARWSSGN